VGVSLVEAVYLVAAGVFLFSRGYGDFQAGRLIGQAIGPGVNPSMLVGVMAVAAFVSFVVARYESGMTGVAAWRLLRGGAGYLMGNCLVAALLAAGSAFAYYGNQAVIGVLGLVIPGLLVLIGAEMLLLTVLGGYRPRRAGEWSRPAYESRVLGLLTSPGSIAKAISEAINYQFGIEVSRSWFYQLLSRAVTPLTAVGLLTLLLLSGVVIVAPHEQAVLTRFGRVEGQPLGPGLHFKLPWPVQTTRKYPVGRVYQVLVGSAPHAVDPLRPVLWVQQHAESEQYMVTAPTPLTQHDRGHAGDDLGASATGVSLIGAEVVVQYRVHDLQRHVAAVEDGRAVITAIAERCMNAYFVSKDIDSLLGPGRSVVGEELRAQIQDEFDKVGLGVGVVFVGLNSVHPPADQGVAGAFLEQIGAMQERQNLIEQADREATELLSSVAGSRDEALAIDQAIVEVQQAGSTPQREAKIEELLTGARGQAAQAIFEARADRWERSVQERAAAERFDAELLAYRHAPHYYRARRYMDSLTRGLAGRRKYVLIGSGTRLPIFRIDLKDTGSAIDSILEGRE